MIGRLVDGAYAAGWASVKALPEWMARSLFRLLADLAWWRRGPRVRRLEANLRRVAPDADPRALSRRGMRSYLRYWMEVFRLPVVPRERIVRETYMIDEHHLRDAMALGRGVVVALPHMGNWDAAGAWAISADVPFTTVAERLKPASLFDRFIAFRRSIGMEVLPLTGGGEIFLQLVRRLRAGGVLCLLADRDLTAGGVEVSFFGAPARMPAGPAALALATGAVLLPATMWSAEPRRGWYLRVHPPIAVPEGADRRARIAAMTQAVADAFAEAIAAHPADWHMLQRLWLADLTAPDATGPDTTGPDRARLAEPVG